LSGSLLVRAVCAEGSAEGSVFGVGVQPSGCLAGRVPEPGGLAGAPSVLGKEKQLLGAPRVWFVVSICLGRFAVQREVDCFRSLKHQKGFSLNTVLLSHFPLTCTLNFSNLGSL